MSERIALLGVVQVVGGEQRRAEFLRDLKQLRIAIALRADAVVLQLDVQRVAPEDVLEPARPPSGLVVVAGKQRLLHDASQAPRGGDQAVGVLGEHLPVHAGLVVVALEERRAGQLQQVPVAGVVLGEQGQVVVELFALAVVARVVDFAVLGAIAAGTLVAALERHVGLGADDRRDLVCFAGPVEVQDAVHVPVVGDSQRGLAVRGCGPDHLVHSRCPVEQRILRVGVQVNERRCHAAPR